jgi:glucose/arabinose dehydrogenase
VFAAFAAPSGASGAVALQPVGTFASPIFVTSPPGDPRLFVVERGGTIRVVKNGATLATPFLDISGLTTTVGERGLLSMAFDPNYATNGLFYVFFNDNGSAGASAGDIHVDEFKVSADPDVATLASRRPVLTISHSAASNHNGGQLQFGKDGDLYISVGEAGVGSNAQTTANLLGKILRIDPHGASPGAHTNPADNPFLGSPGGQEIWSLGLRNPFRFSFDHLTGDMVIGDVGQSAFEEVNFAPAAAGLGRGANYGWNICEGFSSSPSCASLTPPVFAYPNAGVPGCGSAIIGGYVYRGTQVPELAGRYVYSDTCVKVLRSMKLGLPLASDDRSEGVSAPGNVFSFGEDASCNLYVAAGSTVSKLVSTAPPAVAPGCGPAAAKKVCKKKKKHRKKHHATAAKKKHKKHKKCRHKKHKKGKRRR